MEHRRELGVGLEELDVVPEDFLGDRVLLVGLQVHQHVPFVVRVEVLDRAAVQRGRLDVVGGADALVHDRPFAHVAQLELHLGAKVAGGVVVGVGDHEKLAVDDNRLAAADFARSHVWNLVFVR